MQIQGYLEIFFLITVTVLISYPLGKYIARIFMGKRSLLDRYLGPIERGVYWLMGVNPREEMGWREYLFSLLLTNLLFGGIAFAILAAQQYLPLNPNHVGPLQLPLAFTTTISFMTNTNLQHYTGELQLSYFSQMAAITFLMFVSAASGICAAIAFVRGLANQNGKVGNFYRDFVMSLTRLLIPLSIAEALIYVYLGIPQTFQGAVIVHTINMGGQTIFRGPVASLESIKFLGTNGGGYFGADSSYPFENPGPITNYLQMISEAVIPFGLIFSFGYMMRNMREAKMLIAVTLAIFIIGLGIAVYAETMPNPHLATLPINQSAGNWAGKDTRFSIVESTYSLIINTYTQTGGPNVALNQMSPLSVASAMFGMELQSSPGGIGTGLINLLIFVVLAVFISGLMVGRTPEYAGKKISNRVMRNSVLYVLIHPVTILVPIAITVMTHVASLIPMPPNEAFTALLYEFTSAAANNGSSFGYLVVPQTQNYFYYAEAVVMLLGRYAPIAVALAIAGALSEVKPGAYRSIRITEEPVFGFFLFGFIIVLSALLFLPVLALGPLAGYLG